MRLEPGQQRVGAVQLEGVVQAAVDKAVPAPLQGLERGGVVGLAEGDLGRRLQRHLDELVVPVRHGALGPRIGDQPVRHREAAGELDGRHQGQGFRKRSRPI